MAKFALDTQPMLRLLSDQSIRTIHEQALEVLQKTGVHVHHDEAIGLLADCGADVDRKSRMVRFAPDMVLDAVRKVPETFDLYDSFGGKALTIGGNESHFDPGSATVRMLDADGSLRRTVGEDLENIARLTQQLDHIELLSTAIAPDDVDAMIADSYRVYLLLKHTSKPFLAGAFSSRGMKAIHRLLSVAAQGEENLRQRPRAVIDICCTAPLKWTEISCKNIIDAAKVHLPIEILSVPIISAAAPATLAGCVLLHTVELLSGIAFVQSLNPGNRMVYGGAPMYFDMRSNTTSLNSIEANMIAAAYAQMGKFYGMPTHTYAVLSDAKTVDAQAGLESAMSGLVAALAGFNIISGPGALEFCNVLSLEKLVIDNEICGMIKRLQQGILCTDETLAKDTIMELSYDGEYLSCDHTLQWYKKEPYYTSKAIDRTMLHTWQANGAKDAYEHAKEIVGEKLAQEPRQYLGDGVLKELDRAWEEISTE